MGPVPWSPNLLALIHLLCAGVVRIIGFQIVDCFVYYLMHERQLEVEDAAFHRPSAGFDDRRATIDTRDIRVDPNVDADDRGCLNGRDQDGCDDKRAANVPLD